MRNIVFLLVVSLALVGCKAEQVKVELDMLSEFKKYLMFGEAKFDASEESQMQVQPFFDETMFLVAQLVDQPKPAEVLSGLFNQISVSDFCKKIVLPKSTWELLNSRCEGTRGYMCGEEIRALPSIYQKLFGLASSDIRKQFKSTPICKEWL